MAEVGGCYSVVALAAGTSKTLEGDALHSHRWFIPKKRSECAYS